MDMHGFTLVYQIILLGSSGSSGLGLVRVTPHGASERSKHCYLQHLVILNAQNHCSSLLGATKAHQNRCSSHFGLFKHCYLPHRSHFGATGRSKSLLKPARSHKSAQNHCSSLLGATKALQNCCSSHCGLFKHAQNHYCSRLLGATKATQNRCSSLLQGYSGAQHRWSRITAQNPCSKMLIFATLCSDQLCSALLCSVHGYAPDHTSKSISKFVQAFEAR